MKNILFCIVNKELKEIFRDKMCVILFLLPILIFPMLNIGISYISSAMLTKSSTVKIAIIKEENNLVFDNYLNSNCQFKIEIINTDDPIPLLKDNKIDFIIKSSAQNQISFIYNSSNLSSLLSVTKIGEDFEKYAIDSQKTLYPELTTCRLLNESGQVTDVRETVSAIVAPILLITLLAQGSAIFANDFFAGEKERKTLEILFLSGASRENIYFGKLISLCIIELINGILCTASYLLSQLIVNSNTQPISKNSANVSINLILSSLSLIIFSVIFSAFISIISKNIKTAQKANEIFSSLPAVLIGITMFGSFSLNKSIYNFIPIINIVKIFTNAIYLKSNIFDTVTTIVVNLIFCSFIMLISIKYFKSEKILQK